jgi:diguanylate cyclase (GGDEF)-like protein
MHLGSASPSPAPTPHNPDGTRRAHSWLSRALNWRALWSAVAERGDRHGTVSRAGFSANAEIVMWQNELRVVIAAAVALVATGLRVFGQVSGSPTPIAVVVPAYVVLVGLTSLLVRRTRRAGLPLVAGLVSMDLAAIYVTVGLATAPQYYPRALLLSLVALQFTHFVLGVLPSVLAVLGSAIGYVILLATAVHRGVPILWGEQLWMLALYLVVGLTAVILLAGTNRRLTTLVDLFAQAERGDFTREYDERVDRRPDGITVLGRAFNHFRAELASLVLRDPLTGCLNRRGFEQELDRTVARASRYGGEVSLLAIDVDHFKRVNDTYGHLAGDAVLRDLAHVIGGSARAGDLVARVGGEEFVMLLPHTDCESAGVVAERLLEKVRAHRCDVLRDDQRLTVSIGIAAEQVLDDAVASALRARADEALYVAKRLGRDRVVMWASGIRSHTTPAWVPSIELSLPSPRTSRG